MEKDYLKKRFSFYLLPTLFTFANMFCGFYSIILSLNQKTIIAAKLILLGIVFDVLDGRIARLIKKESEFGIEIDSMADLTTFCIAPAILLYSEFSTLIFKAHAPNWMLMLVFLLVVGGALRLVRFNIVKYGVLLQGTKKRFKKSKKSNFDGLPTPASAGFIASFFIASFSVDHASIFLKTIPVIIVFISYLMVSNIEYPSFKEVDVHDRKPFEFMVILIFMVVLFSFFENRWLLIFLMILGYILFGIFREWAYFIASFFSKDEKPNDEKVNHIL